MKRILAIIPSAVLYGKERSNIEVYDLLINKLGYQVDVLVNNRADVRLRKALKGHKIHYILYPNRHAKHCRLLTYVLQYVASNVQIAILMLRLKPDVLFICSELTFYDLYPVLRFFHKKTVYRIGDAPSYEGLAFKQYNKHVWQSYVVSCVSTIVSISKYIQQTVSDTGRKNVNDIQIYNYPPTRKAVTSEEKSLYKVFAHHGVTFGYIGQIMRIKGVDLLVQVAIQILRQHPDSLFYIAGSLTYDKPFGDELVQMVPNNMRDRIVFLDEISNIELFFSHIDVLCVPSVKQEPLGNVIVEAKKYSTPCVIFPSGGMPELIEHGCDGFICKNQSQEALYEGLAFYVSRPDIIPKHSKASYESIAKLKIDRLCFEKKWSQVFETLFE